MYISDSSVKLPMLCNINFSSVPCNHLYAIIIQVMELSYSMYFTHMMSIILKEKSDWQILSADTGLILLKLETPTQQEMMISVMDHVLLMVQSVL